MIPITTLSRSTRKGWGTRQHKLPTLKPELSVVKYGTAEVTTFHNPISLAARL